MHKTHDGSLQIGNTGNSIGCGMRWNGMNCMDEIILLKSSYPGGGFGRIRFLSFLQGERWRQIMQRERRNNNSVSCPWHQLHDMRILQRGGRKIQAHHTQHHHKRITSHNRMVTTECYNLVVTRSITSILSPSTNLQDDPLLSLQRKEQNLYFGWSRWGSSNAPEEGRPMWLQ